MKRNSPVNVSKMPPAGSLSGVDLSKLQSPARVQRLHDGGGLYFELRANGARYWRIRYRHFGRENSLSVGVFPEIGLEAARLAASEVRALLVQGIDPSAARKVARLAEQAAEAESRKPGRFLLSSRGALVVDLPGRAFTLSAAETSELRAFLAATATVGGADHGN